MNAFLAIGFIVTVIYFFTRFAKQEAVEQFYEAVILDVEGRLDWATSRSTHPFAMQVNITRASKLLFQAKSLWRGNKFHQAYQVARESQQAIDKAQSIYISAQLKR